MVFTWKEKRTKDKRDRMALDMAGPELFSGGLGGLPDEEIWDMRFENLRKKQGKQLVQRGAILLEAEKGPLVIEREDVEGQEAQVGEEEEPPRKQKKGEEKQGVDSVKTEIHPDHCEPHLTSPALYERLDC